MADTCSAKVVIGGDWSALQFAAWKDQVVAPAAVTAVTIDVAAAAIAFARDSRAWGAYRIANENCTNYGNDCNHWKAPFERSVDIWSKARVGAKWATIIVAGHLEGILQKEVIARAQTKNDNLNCFNCKEKGHSYASCTKPLLKCTKCLRVGHKYETCRFRTSNNSQVKDNLPKTMRILSSSSSSKYYKEIKINGHDVKAFIDFGSDVTVIKESLASSLQLKPDNSSLPLRGFGNELVQTIGSVTVDMVIDNVQAQVDCRVVGDEYLDSPILIGQTFTEQPHIEVYKNSKQLQFLNATNEMPFSDTMIDDNNGNNVKILAKHDHQLYGMASIKVFTEQSLDGHIFLDSKVIGKPDQQLLVNGGVYPTTTKGHTYIDVSPMFLTCMLNVNPILNEVRQESRDIQVSEIRREVKDRIAKEQQKQKQYYDKNRRPARIYGEADLVKITKTSFSNDGKSKKLIPPYIGPYRVVSVLGNDRYEVAAIPGLTGTKNKRKTIVSASRMMPWVHIAALEVNQSVSDDEQNIVDSKNEDDVNYNDSESIDEDA
ncbi:hypothetical protein OBRU01_11432 [Operophtera brumata]|uniref:Peptidase A2 domain-containing protein n=1 Tax=Operophtera brumata TaxID=104452 RepID=A0A0L7LCJ6_OPEBR|nr:hypothetical protein OBRU01_11432 [Operophtera brumata]